MNIGSSSSHKSPKFTLEFYFVLVVAAGLDGRGRQVSCRGHVLSIFYTSYARDMGSVQSVVRYRDIGWPTTTVDARADRRANAQHSRSLLLLALKLFQGLRDLSPTTARREEIQAARLPVLDV